MNSNLFVDLFLYICLLATSVREFCEKRFVVSSKKEKAREENDCFETFVILSLLHCCKIQLLVFALNFLESMNQ